MSVLLIAALLMTIFPLGAFAAEGDITFSVTCTGVPVPEAAISYAVVVTDAGVEATAPDASLYSTTTADNSGIAVANIGENAQYLSDPTKTVTLFWSASADDCETLSGRTVLTEDITEIPVALNAALLKTAKITIVAPENGTLTVKNGNEVLASGAEVEVGTTLRITAAANNNFTLKAVTANGVELTKTGNSYAVEITKDTEIAAEIGCKITTTDSNNGAVSLVVGGTESKEIFAEAGQMITVRVSPTDGYYYQELRFSSADQASIVGSPVENDDSYDITIQVFGNCNVSATFSNSEPATLGKQVTIQLNDPALGVEKSDHLFVIYPHGSVSISPNAEYGASRVKVNGQKGNPISYDSSVLINSVAVMYKAEDEFFGSWHKVRGIDLNTPLYIVLDDDAPEFTENTMIPDVLSDSSKITWEVADKAEIISNNIKVEGGFSGIKEVSYSVLPIVEEGAEIPEAMTSIEDQVLYSCEDVSDAQGIVESGDEFPAISLAGLPEGNYKLIVDVEDFAGNKSTSFNYFQIDNSDPKISYNEVAPVDGAYYAATDKDPYKVTISINDNNPNIQSLYEAVTAEGAILAFNSNGTPADIVPGIVIDEENSTVTLSFAPGYRYEIGAISCKDLAGNDSNSLDPISFTVDGTQPGGTIFIKEGDLWGDITTALTFGLVYPEKQWEITLNYSDDFGIESVSYAKLSSKEAEKAFNGEFDFASAKWENVSLKDHPEDYIFTVDQDDAFVLVMRLVDKAGNISYTFSNGLIVVDNSSPIPPNDSELSVIAKIDTEPVNKQKALYNDSVSITIFANEANVDDNKYSGIMSVSYEITNEGGETGKDDSKTLELASWKLEKEAVEDSADIVTSSIVQPTGNKSAGALYIPDPSPSADGRIKSIKGTLTIDKKDYPDNDLSIKIYVTDIAGNKAECPEIKLTIDTVAPVVSVKLDPQASSTPNNYYKESRTAKITFNDRNFNQLNTSIVVKKNGSNYSPTISWNGQEATIKFADDGDYVIESISTVDNAKWSTILTKDAVNMPNSYDGAEGMGNRFTIDKTPPKILVSYDNDAVANGKYFNAPRTATIRIEEHNFDRSLIQFTPAYNTISWVDSGDIHTATIPFNEDGEYELHVTGSDKAGNSTEVAYTGAAPEAFVIDTTYEDMITLSGVDDGAAYQYADTVIPEVGISDTNLDTYEVTLVGEQRGQTIDLSKQAQELIERNGNDVTAVLDLFEADRELDGIYTLTVKSADLAGNEDEETITFTVNRFGSVYAYDDTVKDLIANGGKFTQSVDNDLTFTIYNASPINEDDISVVVTRDGRPVEAPFTVERIDDGNGWYSYRVILDKGAFAEDGIYAVSVTSTDDANNTVENTEDNSDGSIKFYVDTTAPQLTSAPGLEKSIVNATKLEVTYTVYDTIGLASVQVLVDGEVVDTATEFDDASNYKGTFVLNEKSSEQHIRFILTDKAGNVTDSDAKGFKVAYDLERDVTVSTNLFVRWYANKGLFWGSTGSVVGLAAAVAAIAAAKKKKKEKSAV